MKNSNDVKTQAQVGDGLAENHPVEKTTEPVVSVMPSINRFIEDLRYGYRSGSRIDVQFDWAHGRMAISH